jgi:hypothetical protein
MNRFTPLFAVGLLIFATATQADIFQWEYINPADPSQGQRQRRLRSLAKLMFALLTSMAVLLLVPRFATPLNASVFNFF